MAKNKEKLKKLLAGLTDFDDNISGIFTSLDQEMSRVTARLKETITAKTLEEVTAEFKSLQKAFKPLTFAFEELKKKLAERDQELRNDLKQKLEEYNQVLSQGQAATKSQVSAVASEIAKIHEQLTELSNRKVKIPDFGKQIADAESKLTEMITTMQTNMVETDKTETSELEKKLKDFEEALKKLRIDFLTRRETGGGNANRQITVNSSTSVLGKYNDINFQASSSIGWRVTTDDTNKWVSISASILTATGGGSGSNDFLTVKEVDGAPTVGSVLTIRVSNGTLTDDGGGQVTIDTSGGVTGITRTVSVITANTTGGTTANTDYVYHASATGITFTLPTAISNTNLYTVKNFTGSSVLVAVSAGQTIDQSATALMASMNESLSFISNGSVWGVV